MDERRSLLQVAHTARQTRRSHRWDKDPEVGCTTPVVPAANISVKRPSDSLLRCPIMGLNHIAIAVPILARVGEYYRSNFISVVSKPLKKFDECVEKLDEGVEKLDEGVEVITVQLQDDVFIKLLHPLGKDGRVAEFLRKNPKGGIHHVCFEVDDIVAVTNCTDSKGGLGVVKISRPTLSADGTTTVFLNPKDNNHHGVDLERPEIGNTISSISVEDYLRCRFVNILGLNHIAIAVPDLAQAGEYYRNNFGGAVSEPVEKFDQGVEVSTVQLHNICIELIRPLGKDGRVAEYLQKNPKEGIHHVSFQVIDIVGATNRLDSIGGLGVVNISRPTLLTDGTATVFLNPEDSGNGALIELQQEDRRKGFFYGH